MTINKLSSGNNLAGRKKCAQNLLLRPLVSAYSPAAVEKSAAGRRNPSNLTATQHAPCVFFYVVALTHLYFMVWCSVVVYCLLHHIYRIMVVQAGQLSGWPVFVRAGIPTPVWAATNFGRRNPGGSCISYLTEVATMAATPASTHLKFTWLFLAIRRVDSVSIPCRLKITADSEYAARLMFSHEFVLLFAGRLPVQGAEVTA